MLPPAVLPLGSSRLFVTLTRSLVAFLAFATLCAWASTASAWIEMDIRSHRATVTVSPEGKAEIRHELVLKVRGGPLQSLDIEGVGHDVEVLGDGTVRPSTNGSAHLWPLNLNVGDDGTLQLGIGAERGLRGGVYRFEFGYQLDLFERGWLERKRQDARLTWVGPRFSAGIDTAKVVFRVPRSETQPSLPTDDGPASAVLLSEVRRGAETDEIELVRAHVARGEPAVWQIDLPAGMFPALRADAGPVEVKGAGQAPVPRVVLLPRTSWWVWAIGAALALLYGVILGIKWRTVRRRCAQAAVSPRALLPLPTWVRVPLAALLLGAAAGFGLSEWPTVAGVCLAGALLLATLLPPLRTSKARGPGE